MSRSQFKARVLELFRRAEASGTPLVITDREECESEMRRATERKPLAIPRSSVRRYDNPTAPVGEQEADAAK